MRFQMIGFVQFVVQQKISLKWKNNLLKGDTRMK